MAFRGAHVVLAARSSEKLANCKQALESRLKSRGVQPQLTTLKLNLASFDSIDEFVEGFDKLGLPLHILVNNAGVMALPESKTQDGFEMQMGTNHLGHFRLTTLLLPKLLASGSSRVVCLTSSAYRLGLTDWVDHPKLATVPYQKWRAYGNSKLANMLFAKELHKRYVDQGLTAVSVHPGGIHTGLQHNVEPWIQFKWLLAGPFFFKTIPQGAATSVYCATTASDNLEGGEWYEDCNLSIPKAKLDAFQNDELRAKLWTRSEELTGVSAP